jgi:acetolactate synthase-1/3 small subunit
MTIVTRGNEQIIEQIKKQLNKLINVIKVVDHAMEQSVERELILVKVNAEPEMRAEILRIVDIFRATIIDLTPKSYTIEMTGDEAKVTALIEMLRPMGIKEIARTGRIAMGRGAKGL